MDEMGNIVRTHCDFVSASRGREKPQREEDGGKEERRTKQIAKIALWFVTRQRWLSLQSLGVCSKTEETAIKEAGLGKASISPDGHLIEPFLSRKDSFPIPLCARSD